MPDGDRLESAFRAWIEGVLGVPLQELARGPVPVVEADSQAPNTAPLWAVKAGGAGVVAARPEWVRSLGPIVSDLHPDLLFSTLGAYEMSRVTLPDGVGVWGPSWFLLGDATTWRPVDESSVTKVSRQELADVDYDLFWHSRIDCLGAFGIHDDGRLVAMATVRDSGGSVWEIGMDVVPDAKLRGLGRAVVSAAGSWILENGKLVLATTGHFNVPSARTLRSLGLRYVAIEMQGIEGPFLVPPQPIGSPYPGADVHDYYPEWAMNRSIKRHPGPPELGRPFS